MYSDKKPKGRPILGQGASNVQSCLSADAPEFIPKQHIQVNRDPLDEVRQTISWLTQSPADFDSSMPNLIAVLSSTVHDEETLIKVVDEIANQGICESNFRYTAARLCDYLSHNFTAQFPSGNFRQHLLKRCHREHSARETTIKEKNGIDHLIGFTLFMGELLLNMTTASNERMKILANAVQELLTLLSSQATDSTLKCVIQSLKLTGSILEEVEKESNPEHITPKMDELFTIIRSNIVDDQSSKSLRRMLLNLIELRATNWGQSSESTPTPQSPLTEAVMLGGVYYGDDGETYTYEDTFIPGEEDDEYYATIEANDYFNQQEYYEQSWSNNDGEMDEEAAAAYEEFLNMQETERQNAANAS